jgi:ABC-type branched-subunit amino acid transport system ATPase component/ABC-type branched-subunit amino acid transport system permease subunit
LEVLFAEVRSVAVTSAVIGLLALSIFAALSSGVFSVATITIAGITGFTTTTLLNDQLPPPLAILVSAVVGGAIALAISYPLLRLSGHWIALATIGMLLIARVIVVNVFITKGSGGIALASPMPTWYLLAVLAISAWFFARIRRSRFGLAVETVRADPTVASAVGLDPVAVQRSAFVQSGVLAGMAGALYANLVQFLSPDTFSVDLAFVALAAVALGGRFHWLGSIVGAFVFTALPVLLMGVLDQGYYIANGVALVAIICLLPGGLIEPGRAQRRRAARAAAAESLRDLEVPGEDIDEARGDVGAAPHRPLPQRESASHNEAVNEPALEVRNVTVRFGGLLALDALSFRVPRGIVFGIVGPNGAGKSTLLNVMSGLQVPDRGTMLLAGRDVTAQPAHARARLGIGRTYQEVRLLRGLTVLETIMVGEHIRRSSQLWQAVLALPSERRERRASEDRARALMDKVGVIGRPEQFAGELSYANQRRVEIARALASSPSVLLVDEPTAGMHRHGSTAIGELLLELREQGLTVVVIEHNLALVLDYCERIVVMNFGQLLSEGPPQQCLRDPQVIEAYFGRRSDAERIESLMQLRQH